MILTFLGTSAGAPTRSRNVTSIALQFEQESRLWLFDCGEGTQQQFLRCPLRLSQVERIWISHMHGDHVFGLPGLLATRALANTGTAPVTLHGPPGLDDFIRCTLRLTQTGLASTLQVQTASTGIVYSDDRYQVTCAPMRHRIEAFGYAVQEREQPGTFDAEKAAAAGVPSGPLFGRLKGGDTVTLSDGRTLRGADFVGPPRMGRRVVVTGDTAYTAEAVALARDADVLVHEATYIDADATMAKRAQHSTSAIAARVALEAGARALILTHISPRYEAGALEGLLSEAKAIFPNTHLASDFWSFNVPRREAQATS